MASCPPVLHNGKGDIPLKNLCGVLQQVRAEVRHTILTGRPAAYRKTAEDCRQPKPDCTERTMQQTEKRQPFADETRFEFVVDNS